MNAAATRSSRSGFALAAAIWSFAFAGLSVLWALGSDIGITTLSLSIAEEAGRRTPSFVTLLWVTVGLKALAGVIALSLVQAWGERLPRWLRLLGAWGAGVLLTLYGLAGIIQALLWKTGVRAVPDSFGADRVNWYLFLWEPIWLIGGLLFLVAAWIAQRRR